MDYQKRKRLHSSSFALEKQRKYPIDTLARAKNALARVSAYGTPEEKYEVRREVFAKYPSLKDGKSFRDFIRQKIARKARG